ncbi:MAG: response regulator [Chitinispirillaceae bacterium]|nr:response regulator [Chitinispirillaceae bacterium]
MKILCVDDDVLILEFFSEALKKTGVSENDILIATNGEHAIDLASREPVDMVILDLLLPGISGIETIKAIRARRPKSEVIVVTGHASAESAVEAMKAGARDYLTKPFNMSILKEKLINLVELLARRKEDEEYRFSMEMAQAGAQKKISSLEETIDGMKKCCSRIQEILDSDRADAEKINAIRAIINASRGNEPPPA